MRANVRKFACAGRSTLPEINYVVDKKKNKITAVPPSLGTNSGWRQELCRRVRLYIVTTSGTTVG